MKPCRVSVVINTLNRAEALETALRSLRRVNYTRFEVIVVNGPSTDHTVQVLQNWAASIRVGSCSDRNLSVSRNVGIEMARGDLVGFIDDDVVVEEGWMDDVVAAFDSEEVGGVGGMVFDHTGYGSQNSFTVCDRFGNAYLDRKEPGLEFCYPGCLRYPNLQGCNCVFRRSALMEIRGFDEEFDYFLDETDVCLRLVDAGYLLKQLPKAFVYHRTLPSHMRDGNRPITDSRPLVKNTVYFGLKNCLPGTGLLPALQQSLHFAAQVDAKKKAWLAATVHEERAVERVSEGLDEALREGLLRGLTQPRRFLASAAAKEMRGAVSMDLWKDGAGEFKPFPVTPEASQKLTVCLLSSGYLPEKNGGIARFTHDLACGLAARGHVVHVLTASTTGRNSVGFENDVWVHRLAPAVQVAAPPSGIPVAQPIWRHSATMLRELHRIRTMRPIDLVEAPLWDAEGIAAVLDGSFRVVTWLQTPLKSWIETNLSLVNGSRAQQQFFQDQVAAETLVMERAGGIRACSQAIVNTIEESYGVALRHDRLAIIPLGMEDRSHGADLRRADDFVDILFTGRFERRKGIDVLFEAIPALCLRHPKVRFIMAGEEALMPGGLSLRERFRESLAAAPFRDRVVLAGKVSDEELERYLARCDIYVAPSRYESFGLVFLEAMMFGKPAIGCRAGGMPEVIEDGVTGLLAEPGDAGSLIAALERLIVDRALRQHLGEAARRRYLARYTRDHLIDRTLEFYRRVLGS